MKDTKKLTALINGEFLDIVAWKKSGGGEFIAVEELKENHPRTYKNLKAKGIIKQKKTGRYPDIKLKEFVDG